MDDLIKRADAMAYIERVINSGLGRNKSLDYIHKYISALPSAETHEIRTETHGVCLDLISREDAICEVLVNDGIDNIVDRINALPSAEAEWIPCSERLPKELERVNVTWLNHNPPVYYQHIKDIPQIDTAVYYRGKWYWWDSTVIDVLAEYGEDCNAEQIDKDIEFIAWMPLPKPYREESEVKE